MRGLAAILGLGLALGSVSPLAAQDDALKTARDLYASAAYVEALAELTRVESTPAAAPATIRDTNAYRTFCLVALGRDAEAQKVAEALVRKDPMLSIDQFPDASPRIATMFAAVRRRVLPQLIKDEYRVARTSATENAPDAEVRLRHVRQLLDTAKQIDAWDDTLADVRLIVDGFLDLAHAAQPARASSEAPRTTAAVAKPAALTTTSASPSKEFGFVAPTAVFQPQPTIPPSLLTIVRRMRRTSTIEVAINERGTVDDVTVKEPVTPAYDRLVVAAARTWRYKPALKDGVPIKSVSTVVIDVGTE
jgi:TonB family protein